MAKRAAGKISANRRVHRLLRFLRIFGEEHCALKFVAGMELVAQLFDLLSDETRYLALQNSAFQPRIIRVLRGQTAQECSDQFDVAMGNVHFRISPVELK